MRKLPRKYQRTLRIVVKASGKERSELVAGARRAGMPLSTFLREAGKRVAYELSIASPETPPCQ